MTSLISIFSVIALGWVLGRGFIKQEVWKDLEKITYFVFLPLLFFQKISQGPELSRLSIEIVIMIAVYCLVFLFTFFFRFFTDHASFTSMVQGSIRFNAYIVLILASSVLGEAALEKTIFFIAFLIPLVNLLTIVAFSWQAGPTSAGTENRSKVIVRSVVTNPLIVSCCLGIAVNLSGVSLPSFLEWMREFVDILTRPALTLGLLAVGSGIKFRDMGEQGKLIVTACLFKFLVLPGVMYGVLEYFAVTGDTRIILVTIAIMPTATSAYILSRQLGGNSALMANIVTVETLLSGGVTPLVLWWLYQS